MTNHIKLQPVTCGWTSVIELTPPYSLKHNQLEVIKSIVLPPPHLAPNFFLRTKINPSPSCTTFLLKIMKQSFSTSQDTRSKAYQEISGAINLKKRRKAKLTVLEKLFYFYKVQLTCMDKKLIKKGTVRLFGIYEASLFDKPIKL